MGQQTTQTPTEILFPDNRRARLVSPPAKTQPADIVQALNLAPPQAVIVLSGGAGNLEDSLKPRLFQFFSRGIARVAVEKKALIIDGGTQSGVMEMMGRGVADREWQTPLLGVAPAGRVTYPGFDKEGTPLEANHSHFVLVDTDEWGGETKTMFDVAAALAQDGPVVTVLVNGGSIAKQEILRSAREGWPVVVLAGSGRLADELAALWQERPDFIPDAVLAEIIADGNLHLLPVESTVAAFERLLGRLIDDQSKGNTTLELAWRRFARYDTNAIRQQKNFKNLQIWILRLGVLGTLLVVVQASLRLMGFWPGLAWLDRTLHYIIVFVPITTSALIAAANRFDAGNKWVLLRGSTEAIKREIFRYRARAEIYSRPQTIRTSPEAKLARKVESISRQLMQTEVNLSALRPYTGPIPPAYILSPGDDGLSALTPDQYLAFRLENQLNFYRDRSLKLEKQLRRYQWLIYIAGGAGTLLAAVGLDLWIALTTALVAAFTTYLEYQQVENTLVKYNQGSSNLANVRAWWLALSAEEQASQDNIDKLVSHTEKIIKNEHAGWVQEMQDALADLRAQQTRESDEQAQTPTLTDEES
ncbi:MAG: DUF4231 domain-containing protein [Anaerolineae bacterium]|nr:DUF4231 domain-containing protein [Anaerolineae bacterium]